MYAIVCQSVRAPSCSVQGCDGMHVNIPSVVKLREGTAHDNDHLAKKAHTHAQYIYIYIYVYKDDTSTADTSWQMTISERRLLTTMMARSECLESELALFSSASLDDALCCCWMCLVLGM